jgi:hypothetical protein
MAMGHYSTFPLSVSLLALIFQLILSIMPSPETRDRHHPCFRQAHPRLNDEEKTVLVPRLRKIDGIQESRPLNQALSSTLNQESPFFELPIIPACFFACKKSRI